MPLEQSKVKVEVEIDVPNGDSEGKYKTEFREKLAERILNILLDKKTEPANQVVEKILNEKD